MSKLRNKLASLNKKVAMEEKIEVIGYEAYKGMSIEYKIRCLDNGPEGEKFANKILSNRLKKQERDYIVDTVAEYFADHVEKDENLFEYGIAEVVIDAMEGILTLPKGLINEEWLNANCTRKNSKTKEMVFNKNKFRALPLSEKAKVVNNPIDFFYKVWGDEYRLEKCDMSNLVRIEGFSPSNDINMEDEASKTSFRKTLASLYK